MTFQINCEITDVAHTNDDMDTSGLGVTNAIPG